MRVPDKYMNKIKKLIGDIDQIGEIDFGNLQNDNYRAGNLIVSGFTIKGKTPYRLITTVNVFNDQLLNTQEDVQCFIEDLQRNHYRKTKYVVYPWLVQNKPNRNVNEDDLLHKETRMNFVFLRVNSDIKDIETQIEESTRDFLYELEDCLRKFYLDNYKTEINDQKIEFIQSEINKIIEKHNKTYEFVVAFEEGRLNLKFQCDDN
jgi:hypothetical protein